MSTVEITDMNQLRVGDVAKFRTQDGTKIEGTLREYSTGELYVTLNPLGGLLYVTSVFGSAAFVGATREVPDPPTEVGSVIVDVTTTSGGPIQMLVLDYGHDWCSPHTGNEYTAPEILSWTAAKIVKETA